MRVGAAMIFGSLCSGIEAASVASKDLGWKPAFFSEIEKFPNRVLEHHYPETHNFGDMTNFKEWPDADIELLCGGTPCQSFSIAGLRKGLDDSRGNLMLTFAEMAAKLRPSWIFWENVPGVLSSGGGRDFASFLGLISGRKISVPSGGWGKAGVVPGYKNAYGIAYRIFDAQYFGVAQRRRRVFVVGYLGDWRPAAAVLLERESLQGNPAPRREKGQKIAPCVTNGPPFSRTGNERVEAEAMAVASKGHWDGGPHPSLTQATQSSGGIGQSNQELFSQGGAGLVPHLVGALDTQCGFEKATHQSIANGHQMAVSTHRMVCGVAQTLRGEGFDASEDGTGRQNLVPIAIPINMQSAVKNGKKSPNGTGIGKDGDPANTLGANDRHAVAMAIQERAVCENPLAGPDGVGIRDDDAAYTLEARSVPQSVSYGMVIRRLTPVECERLQGFPDNYTNVPDEKGKPAADGPRYKALGNSWAVPNVTWIFKRIDKMKALLNERHSDLI